MKVGAKFFKHAVSSPVKSNLLYQWNAIKSCLIAGLGIMHGGGGNISVKLNDSNFWGE